MVKQEIQLSEARAGFRKYRGVLEEQLKKAKREVVELEKELGRSSMDLDEVIGQLEKTIAEGRMALRQRKRLEDLVADGKQKRLISGRELTQFVEKVLNAAWLGKIMRPAQLREVLDVLGIQVVGTDPVAVLSSTVKRVQRQRSKRQRTEVTTVVEDLKTNPVSEVSTDRALPVRGTRIPSSSS